MTASAADDDASLRTQALPSALPLLRGCGSAEPSPAHKLVRGLRTLVGALAAVATCGGVMVAAYVTAHRLYIYAQ